MSLRTLTAVVGAVSLAAVAIAQRGGTPPILLAPGVTDLNATLTAVPGIRVGHHTLTERPTGCTAILAEAGVTAGFDVRGSAPATAETDLLKPINLVQQVFAISLSGGSAFGLDARSGIMRYLDERSIGFKAFGNINVPIVPAASLIDLNVGGNPKIRPTAECGYEAAKAATTGPVAEGNVGAGAGATLQAPRAGENTTLGVVATNATLTKTQATKVAEMAHDGFARAIYPSHTMGDGDTIFALATGGKAGDADVTRIGALASTVIAQAIVRAATQAKSIPDYPAIRDLR